MKLINKIKISLLVALFIVILFNLKIFAVTGVITEITVNLRKEPSTNSKKIMYVTQDDKVEVLEKVGDWYKIKFKNTTGYVFGKYVKVDDSKLETTTNKDTQKVDTIKKEETITNEEVTDIKNKNKENQESNVNTNLIIKNKTKIKLIPNISSNVIYTASKDIKINIIEQLKEWSYIEVDNILGWVRTDKIVEKNEVLPDNNEKKEDTSKTETKQETKIAYIKYDTVNLRKKASTSATVLAKLKLNDKVTVLEKVNSTWSKVKVDGVTGYISTELLSDSKQEEKKKDTQDSDTTSRDSQTTTREEEIQKPVTSIKNDTTIKQESTSDSANKKEESNKETTTSKTTGEDIVAYAKKYLGYDYVYGGASPKTGFDCSGLTYYVYKHFGYTISRSSKAQAKNGKEVAKSDLQPGDLIIFKNQALTAIGHVGIYVGNNKIIHASEPGVGVVITNMDASGYNYNKRYVTARRILN